MYLHGDMNEFRSHCIPQVLRTNPAAGRKILVDDSRKKKHTQPPGEEMMLPMLFVSYCIYPAPLHLNVRTTVASAEAEETFFQRWRNVSQFKQWPTAAPTH